MSVYLILLVALSSLCRNLIGLKTNDLYEDAPNDDEVMRNLVSLQIFDSNLWKHKCTGTVIDKLHIITAASCFHNTTMCEFRVVGPSTSMHLMEADFPRTLFSMYIHPKYTGSQQRSYDIAVATVTIPFNLDKSHWAKISTHIPAKIERVKHVQWTDKAHNALLVEADEEIVACVKKDGRNVGLCINRRYHCSDDMGSPIFIRNTKLVGILTMNPDCEEVDTSAFVRFTRVTKFKAFIDDSLDENWMI